MAEFSLDLNEEQRDLRDWVHGFAAEVVRPAAAEWDEREETPWPVIQEAAKIGLYGFEFLATCWADPTGLSLPIASEELFWGDAGIGLSIFGTSLAVAAIYGSGTPDQMVEWVPQCFGDVDRPEGRRVLHHRAGGRLRRRRDAHPGRLRRGHRRVGAQRPEGVRHQRRHRRTCTWSPPPSTRRSAPAVRRRSSYRRAPPAWPPPASCKKLGLRASHTADVFLDDVRVPGRCLLGGTGRARRSGWPGPAPGSGPPGRPRCAPSSCPGPTVGAQALGVARAAYEYALDYAKDRVQFGRPIIENQAIAFALADMRMEIDAARLLVWRAAWMGRNNRPFTAGEGSMSKLKAGEVAVSVTEKAVQILGGAGFLRDHPVERWYRDAKIYTIFEGTSEIQRLVISRAISGMQIR